MIILQKLVYIKIYIPISLQKLKTYSYNKNGL
jgi:hypothetical protein